MTKAGREVEVKFRIDDPNEVRDRLRSLGATTRGAVHERNIVYDAGNRFRDSGELLRLRQDRRAVLTYKRPIPDPKYKVREELEVEVSDFETASRLLERLGFTPALIYEKERETWILGRAEVEIDRLPFGWFVEIEAAEEQLDSIARSLGLDPANGLADDYVSLYRQYCAERGIEPGNITFDTPGA